MLGYRKFVCDECDAIIYLKDIAYRKAMIWVEEAGKIETGGILVGRYSSSLKKVYINDLSNAPSDSKAGFCWFIRGVRGLRDYLKKKWNQNDEYYLGEWHFHPLDVPNPSSTDIAQLKKIPLDKRFNCKEPILIIVSKNSIVYNISINLLLCDSVYSFYECEA